MMMTPTEIILYNILGSLIGAGIPVAIAVWKLKSSLASTTEDMDVGEIMEEGMEAVMGGMDLEEGDEVEKES